MGVYVVMRSFNSIWYASCMQDPGLQFMANGVSSGSTPLEALTRAGDGTPSISPEDQAAASSGSFKLPSWI